jgi:hypothetical protein
MILHTWVIDKKMHTKVMRAKCLDKSEITTLQTELCRQYRCVAIVRQVSYLQERETDSVTLAPGSTYNAIMLEYCVEHAWWCGDSLFRHPSVTGSGKVPSQAWRVWLRVRWCNCMLVASCSDRLLPRWDFFWNDEMKNEKTGRSRAQGLLPRWDFFLEWWNEGRKDREITSTSTRSLL